LGLDVERLRFKPQAVSQAERGSRIEVTP
jgi:hypothetical protein